MRKEHVYETELSQEAQEQFLDFLHALPSSGFGFRGDYIHRAYEIQELGFYDRESHYLAFVPPLIKPKVWSKEAQQAYKYMQEGLEYALTFADAYRNYNVTRYKIYDKEFHTYSKVIEDNPTFLSAICVFIADQPQQFLNVMNHGKTFHSGQNIDLKAGKVKDFGVVSSENIAILSISLEEIKAIETFLLEQYRNSGFRLSKITDIFYKKHEGLTKGETEYLKANYLAFRHMLVDLMLKKLMSLFTQES